MAEMQVEYKGGWEFRADSRSHSIIIDLPAQMKGEDKGMTPPELFIASLASCVGVYVVDYCKAQNISTDGLKVVANYEDVEGGPARIGKISLEIVMPGGVPQEHRNPLMKMAAQCKVHNTICTLPDIRMTLTAG